MPHFTPELGDVMNYLKMSPIIRASVPRVGTQLKIMVTLEGGQKALLIPQWYLYFFMCTCFYFDFKYL